MEAMIFIILGVMLVNGNDMWKDFDAAFAVCALIFVLLIRFVG